MRRLLTICGLCLLLSGCCCGSNPVPPDVLAKIVLALTGAAALANQRDKAGTAFAHYVRLRAAYLGSKNSSWTTEANYSSLTTRIGAELNLLYAVITEQQAKITVSDTTVPQHRDLQDAAKRLVTDGPSTVFDRLVTISKGRKHRIEQIVWRAGAVHADLWSGGDSTLSPALKKPALIEVLDRRLNIIEMMILHDQGPYGTWTLTSLTAGWKDQQRTSMFQYPWVFLKDDPPTFTNALTALGKTVSDLSNFNHVPTEGRIYVKGVWNHPRPPAAADWTVSDKPYVMTYVQTDTPAAAMERLVPSDPKTPAIFEDFLQRNLIYCDMMIAALHVSALRFALKRRNGNDDEFNASADDGITLRNLIPHTGVPIPSELMDEGDDWFQGVSIPHDELQLGDQLVIWNSPFVRHILHSAFGLENSLVTAVAPDGVAVMLAGHGAPELDEKAFNEGLSSEIKSAYAGLRKKISSSFSANPNVAALTATSGNIKIQCIRWAPYGEDFKPSPTAELQADGSWWVRMRRTDLRDPPPTIAEALVWVPMSVAVDADLQTPPSLPANDVHDPDYKESIYLPLSVPKGLKGGWAAYFNSPQENETVILDDFIPDGRMVPGFFAKGPASTIPTFRPKLRT